jgi:hypothetical protein
MGIVMTVSVTMTSFGEGSLLCRGAFADAAWRAVESRETNIDPTLPGSPVLLHYKNIDGKIRQTHH